MNPKLIAMFLGAAFVAVAPAPANASPPEEAASCAARIERLDVRAGSGYLPFSGAATELPVEIGFDAPEGCRLGLVLRSAGGGRLSATGEPLNYQVRDAAGRVLALDGASRVDLAAGASKATLSLALPPGQAARAGRYGDRLFVKLVDGERILEERALDIIVPVPSQASVSLAGSAAAGFSKTFGTGLDFGELAYGKEREAFLFVLANAAYSLRLSSANGGRLRHSTERDTVDYVARLDGRVLDLAGAVVVDGRPDGRWLSWPPYRLNVRIGEVQGRTAGIYRDTITVDVLLLE